MAEIKPPTLTIFEGPDCGGKSTIADYYRSIDGGTLIHHGPYLDVGNELASVYIDAMQPLVDGKEAQIWDRCWLSEPIYGSAFREGANRIDVTSRRQLERKAIQYSAIVVLCLPPWDEVREKWQARKGLNMNNEMLERITQLLAVYDGYEKLSWNTSLPVVVYDYTRHNKDDLVTELISRRKGDM